MYLAIEKWKSDVSIMMIVYPIDYVDKMSGSFYNSSPTLEQQAWVEYNDINLTLVIDGVGELPKSFQTAEIQSSGSAYSHLNYLCN